MAHIKKNIPSNMFYCITRAYCFKYSIRKLIIVSIIIKLPLHSEFIFYSFRTRNKLNIKNKYWKLKERNIKINVEDR